MHSASRPRPRAVTSSTSWRSSGRRAAPRSRPGRATSARAPSHSTVSRSSQRRGCSPGSRGPPRHRRANQRVGGRRGPLGAGRPDARLQGLIQLGFIVTSPFGVSHCRYGAIRGRRRHRSCGRPGPRRYRYRGLVAGWAGPTSHGGAPCRPRRNVHGLPARGHPVPGRSRREQRPRLVHATQGRVRALLKEPLEALILALGDRFAAREIPLEADPARSPFRIYRDVRFSKDKSPYKTNVAASFPWAEGGDADGPARLRRERQSGRLLPPGARRGVRRRRDVASADGQARGLPRGRRRRPEGRPPAARRARGSRGPSERSRATS